MWVPQLPHTSKDTRLLLRRIMETWKLKKRLSLHGIMRYLEAMKKIGEGSTHPFLPLIPPLLHTISTEPGRMKWGQWAEVKVKIVTQRREKNQIHLESNREWMSMKVGWVIWKLFRWVSFATYIPTALLCPHVLSCSDFAMFHSCWKFKSNMTLTWICEACDHKSTVPLLI